MDSRQNLYNANLDRRVINEVTCGTWFLQEDIECIILDLILLVPVFFKF